jgi:anaphase-promoting complex subunit 11
MEVHSPVQLSSRKRRNETTEATESGSNENRMYSNRPLTDGASSKNNNASSKVQLKVRIKRFHGVAFWTWGANTKDDVCSICQNAFEGVCPGVKFPGEDCPVVWGKCQHAFHLQCINTWLTSTNTTASATVKNSCPICRQEWEFSSSTPASTDAVVAATSGV